MILAFGSLIKTMLRTNFFCLKLDKQFCPIQMNVPLYAAESLGWELGIRYLHLGFLFTHLKSKDREMNLESVPSSVMCILIESHLSLLLSLSLASSVTYAVMK